MEKNIFKGLTRKGILHADFPSATPGQECHQISHNMWCLTIYNFHQLSYIHTWLSLVNLFDSYSN
jgi:hypothetical protein